MDTSKFTAEDYTTKDAIGVVIFDADGKVLIQDHIKLDFFTIPIGKVKNGELPEEVMIEEILEETNLRITNYLKIADKVGEYDYEGTTVRLKNHIYKILSYEGEMQNREPKKHRSMSFMAIDDIKKLPKISDATKIFLSTLN